MKQTMKERNPYDPESLLSSAEAATGMTYENSQRTWPDEATHRKAIAGQLTPNEILRLAPRVFLIPDVGHSMGAGDAPQ
jgi:hypothetical protein